MLAIALAFERSSGVFAVRTFSRRNGHQGYFEAVRSAKDPTIFMLLFEDSAAILGIAIAFLGIVLAQQAGVGSFDGGASIATGLVPGVTAILRAREVRAC